MGRRGLALVVALAGTLAMPALAAECTLVQAHYSQVNSSWTLRFEAPVAPAVANQAASFVFSLGEGEPEFTGAVYSPNGLSEPYATLEPKCLDGDQTDTCKLWEGVIYAGGADTGIVKLPDLAVPAPQQILLPGLGSSMYYSAYASIGYAGEPNEVFTLARCDK